MSTSRLFYLNNERTETWKLPISASFIKIIKKPLLSKNASHIKDKKLIHVYKINE